MRLLRVTIEGEVIFNCLLLSLDRDTTLFDTIARMRDLDALIDETDGERSDSRLAVDRTSVVALPDSAKHCFPMFLTLDTTDELITCKITSLVLKVVTIDGDEITVSSLPAVFTIDVTEEDAANSCFPIDLIE
jgi:hypothetical protein